MTKRLWLPVVGLLLLGCSGTDGFSWLGSSGEGGPAAASDQGGTASGGGHESQHHDSTADLPDLRFTIEQHDGFCVLSAQTRQDRDGFDMYQDQYFVSVVYEMPTTAAWYGVHSYAFGDFFERFPNLHTGVTGPGGPIPTGVVFLVSGDGHWPVTASGNMGCMDNPNNSLFDRCPTISSGTELTSHLPDGIRAEWTNIGNDVPFAGPRRTCLEAYGNQLM